jgi:voltage-gated potassium channel Kch
VAYAEVVLDFFFGMEVVIRYLTCPNRVTFCLGLYNLVDLAAIILAWVVRALPNTTLITADEDQSWIQMMLICALPVVRLLKLLRRFETFHLILKAFRLASEALPVLLFILVVLVLVFASIIFIVEPRSNITSLSQSLWFTIVTVGTIGYGDITPESTAGRLVSSVLVIVSALYMAIPIGIVGKAFSTVWDDRDRLLLMYRTKCRFLSSGYKAEDVPAMFFSFDTNGDGELSLEEFREMMTNLQIEISGRKLVELFETFDGDGSGGIDDSEFVQTLFPHAFARIYGNGTGSSEEEEEPDTPLAKEAS